MACRQTAAAWANCAAGKLGRNGDAQVQQAQRTYARLSFADGDVVVTLKDRDIFLISAERATEACRQAIEVEQRIRQFESAFLVPLHDWRIAHSACVHACYIAVPKRPFAYRLE